MVNCLLLRLKFSRNLNVNYQNVIPFFKKVYVLKYAENCPKRISLQANSCFIMHDAFEIMR